ncbi:phosphoserine phosphatase SerB [Sphingomonas sp. ASV193]|uniref:phosphoserine phosphatase SerB n=1 Tax=Sphingomonas sp. ASV193 TaxID=3144405 RepID=UPI0032E8EE6E
MAIATVIAAGRLDDRLLGAALDAVPGARFDRWIDEGDAADLACDGEPAAIRAALAAIAGLDVAILPDRRPAYRLFVADMDSTMIGQECIDELADYAGVKPQVAAITERAMQGELDFREALAERVALLRGLDRGVIDRCRDERIRPNPGAATLVATLRAHGVKTALVSGGFTAFVEPIAEELGFDRSRANVLGIDGVRLTGTTVGEIVDGSAKERFARDLVEETGASAAQLIAVGDGANDSKMVSLAGLGVAYRAKPALDAVADAAIRHHPLTALLWMIGIPKAAWVRVP